MDEIQPPHEEIRDQEAGTPPEQEHSSRASVSLLITQEQKAALRERGYTDERIREMKPEDAHRELGLIN